MNENENVQMNAEQQLTKALVEIMVFGKDTDKQKVHELNVALQDQINKHSKAHHRVRIFWRINNDETSEQMKQWMVEKSCCKYYVFATDGTNYSVKGDFVLGILNKIKKLEDALLVMKNANIIRSSVKPVADSIPDAVVVE
jgi:hypothetical protein